MNLQEPSSDSGQPNYLILDAIHSANSSFKKLSTSINHTPDASVETQVGEIAKFIKDLFASKTAASTHHEV